MVPNDSRIVKAIEVVRLVVVDGEHCIAILKRD
jgi:hypothetical protein